MKNSKKNKSKLFDKNKKVNAVIGTKRDEYGTKGSTKGLVNSVRSYGIARMESRKRNTGAKKG